VLLLLFQDRQVVYPEEQPVPIFQYARMQGRTLLFSAGQQVSVHFLPVQKRPAEFATTHRKFPVNKPAPEFVPVVQKLNDLTRVITDSMNEIAAGAVQINNAVQEVNEITQKNKHNIESLVAEVNKFKV